MTKLPETHDEKKARLERERKEHNRDLIRRIKAGKDGGKRW